MENGMYWQALFTLVFVIALMGVLAMLVKKAGLMGAPIQNPKGKRLSLIESLPIDARRRVVIVRQDDAEHLLLLGMESEIVIAQNINSAKTKLPSQNDKAA